MGNAKPSDELLDIGFMFRGFAFQLRSGKMLSLFADQDQGALIWRAKELGAFRGPNYAELRAAIDDLLAPHGIFALGKGWSHIRPLFLSLYVASKGPTSSEADIYTFVAEQIEHAAQIPPPPRNTLDDLSDVLTRQARKIVKYLWNKPGGRATFDELCEIQGAFRWRPGDDETIATALRRTQEGLNSNSEFGVSLWFSKPDREVKLDRPPDK